MYNPSLAPRVVDHLRKTFPSIHLLMIGSDRGDGSIQATQDTVNRLGVGGYIELIGGIAKSDVPSWLNKADIFINTTNIDNTPVSVIEAMASGLCIVSTKVGGIPYLLDHDHDALLVPPDDPESMAAAVRRILTEPGLAEYLSQNARRKAEQFDWVQILPHWEKLLTFAQ
jgi:glycosyltransferase involved in cell wall biosynthesis